MESYFEQVVERLTAPGYRWYETANFCRHDELAGGRDLRARHNLGYWLGHDYLGLGVGAVSTIENRRWRNAPSLPRYLAALEAGSGRIGRSSRCPPRPGQRSGCCSACGSTSLSHSTASRTWSTTRSSGGWPSSGSSAEGRTASALTTRGRFLGGGVTARLLA